MSRRGGGIRPDGSYVDVAPLESHKNLAERVYQHLFSAIHNLQINAGEELNEVRLAERLGVSVTPVREALLRLAGDGLVVREPQRPPRVVRLTLKQIEELYDVRGTLEAFAAAEAAKKATDGDLQRLRALQQKGQRFAVEGRSKSYDAYNDEWHQIILRLAGNDLLIRMMQPLRVKARLCMSLTSILPGRRSTGLAEHEAIVSLIGKGDAAGAAEAMRQHCKAGKCSYLEHYGVLGDFGRVEPTGDAQKTRTS